MPKARPLPADPEEKAKVIRRRRQVKLAVDAWRSRNPDKARTLIRHCVKLHRIRKALRMMRNAA